MRTRPTPAPVLGMSRRRGCKRSVISAAGNDEQMVDEPLNQPIAVLAVICAILLVSTFVAAHAGRRIRALTGEEQELLRVVVGATLTLLALIVGFSLSMATNRYDQRKNLEEAEANAIGTELLRVELLPSPLADRAGQLLRDYLALRITFYRESRAAKLDRINAQTNALESQLWSAVRAPLNSRTRSRRWLSLV